MEYVEKVDFSNPFNYEYMDWENRPRTAEEIEEYREYVHMPVYADIETYVRAGYLRKYQEALENAVRNGSVGTGRSTEKVPQPEYAEVTDSRLVRMECTRMDGKTEAVYADAVLEAGLDIYQRAAAQRLKSYRDRTGQIAAQGLIKDHVTQWYRVSGTIDPSGRDSSVSGVEIYSRWKRRKGRGLSEYLIPVIPAADMDKEAERILIENGMADAVSECKSVDTGRLIRNMGLTVVPARLSCGDRIKAKLFLHDGCSAVYDESGRKDYLEVNEGTILLDEQAAGTDADRNEANAHECAHMAEHRAFYRLQRAYNDNIGSLTFIGSSCTLCDAEDTYEAQLESEQDDADNDMDPVSWAEWQARMLAPRILMPETQTRKKIRELIRRYRNRDENMAETYEKVIPELASFYCVSVATARKRMIWLGFQDAQGALNYMDGHYIPAYTTTTGRTRNGTGYSISSADALKLYESDALFRAAVDSGSFVFTENHYCLNRPEYVQGGALTHEARSHIEQCCILFRISNMGRRAAYDRDALHNDDWKNDPVAVALAAVPVDAFLSSSEVVASECEDLPRRFGKTLAYHREKAGLSQEELAWQAGISDRQLRRLENDEVERPSQQLIAELGRVMKLKGCFTLDMMEKAGCGLHRDLPEEMVLYMVVNYMYMRTRDECNQVLLSRNCRPLGGRNKEQQAAS